MTQSGVIAVITIMLALIVKAALEAALKPLFDGTQTWPDILGLPFAQLVVFFILTLRFYLGALRFGATEPKRIDFLIRSFNFVLAFAVFCTFYALALSVTRPEFFYLEIVILHCIDAAWFGTLLLLSHLKFIDEAELETGELPIRPVRRIMIIYLSFSLLTIAFGVLGYRYGFEARLTEPTAVAAHWSFLVFLLVISMVDFWALYSYYFDFEKWRAMHAKK
jgi:hypothetical protein